MNRPDPRSPTADSGAGLAAAVRRAGDTEQAADDHPGKQSLRHHAAPDRHTAATGHAPTPEGRPAPELLSDGVPRAAGRTGPAYAAGPADPADPADAAVGSALLLVGAGGAVLACTPQAEDLFGLPSGGVCGRKVDELFPDQSAWQALTDRPSGLRLGAGRRDARTQLQASLLRLDGSPQDGDTDAGTGVGSGPGADIPYILRLAPAGAAERQQEEEALVRALFSQSRVGLIIHDAALQAIRTNLDHGCFRTERIGTRLADPRRPESYLEPEDAAEVVSTLSRVADSGEPLIAVPHRARCLGEPQTERIVSLSALPLHDTRGRGRGVLTSVIDITDSYRDKRRLAMVSDAAKRIGTSLDVARCAEELTDFLVPEFADLVAVDLTEVVLVGEEPGDILHGAPFTRVAAASSDGVWPAELYAPGETARIRSLETEYLRRCAASLPDFESMRAAFSDDEHRSRLLLPDIAASYMFVPLHARGLVLGSVNLWRKDHRVPFDEQDAELAEEIISRTALAVDNARRYTQERRTAEALRRSLLPPAIVEVSAAEAAGTCLPAATTAGVGGTWFDVIPLSSARVAFVVGDSVGHGLEATAATGRLRTAVQTLSDLDLPPEELLAHLDDLVLRLSAADPDATGAAERIKGSTCLYVVYDPVTGRCTMASAGHAPPAVVGRDGASRLVDCTPGPPLGEGSDPFEPVDIELEAGGLLAFYSGNLVAADVCGPEPYAAGAPGPAGVDPAVTDPAVTGAAATDEEKEPAAPYALGAGRLCRALDEAARQHSTPERVVRDALAALVPEPPAADTTLMVARPRGLAPGQTACWQFPADPAIVGQAREAVTSQLADWGLDELAGTTELIASELITNAIRYAGGPVQLRVMKDETLICEVSDPTQTQPHLRRARLTDEGGRGLFLIHQLTQRWGSRYTCSGKTIWTEQHLP